MEKSHEIISVVVPIFNVEDYIRSCLLSITKQTYSNLEIILVNDGSTDNFYNKIEDIIKQDGRIKLFSKDNGGLSSARNYGIEKATGDYLVFVDSDDTIDKKFIERLYLSLKRTDSDISMCGIRILDYSYKDIVLTTDVPPTNFLEERVYDKFGIWNSFFFENKEHSYAITVVWNKIYKKTLFSNIRFDEGRIFEDEFFTYRIFDICKKISIIPDPLYEYKRNRSGSIINLNRNQEKKELIPLLYRSIYFIKNKFNNNVSLRYLDKFIYCYYFNFNFADKEFNRLVWKYYLSLIFKVNFKFIFKKHFLRLFFAPFRKKKTQKVQEPISFKKCVLIGTPEHGNLGDQAIARSTVLFLNDNNISFSEITYKEYFKYRPQLLESVPELILLQGGGNMGNNWINEEKLRWDVILTFPNAKIIVLPQTIHFEDSYNKESCIDTISRVYTSHKNLTVYAREKTSFDILTSMGIKPKLVPDMVLYNEPQSHLISKLNKIIVISRRDKEKNKDSQEKMKELISILENQGFEIEYCDTVIDKNITPEERNNILDEFLSHLGKCDLIITDRLHGMIFSYITSTPAIVFSNYNHKVNGTYDIIKSKNLFLFKDNTIDEALNFIDKTLNDNIEIKNKWIKDKYDIIKKELKEYGI